MFLSYYLALDSDHAETLAGPGFGAAEEEVQGTSTDCQI